jgi:hypothetical protein
MNEQSVYRAVRNEPLHFSLVLVFKVLKYVLTAFTENE